jgi:NAD(P)-dependent dehydrogenase (short-subunit alcohol dehydrogenase family)
MGIGYACSATFARSGAKVVIVDINAEIGQRAVSAIEAEGGQRSLHAPTSGPPKMLRRW